jgi:hypothetical protein
VRFAVPPLPPTLLPFHSEIPYKSGMRAALQQRRLLSERRLKPVSHANTLSTGTDTLRRERHFLPSLKAEVATPHIR